MNCKNCGNQLVPGDKFCRNCGTNVDNLNGQNIINQQNQNINMQPSINNQTNNNGQTYNNFQQPSEINSNATSNMNQNQNIYSEQQVHNQDNQKLNTSENIFSKYKIVFIIGLILLIIIIVLSVILIKQQNKKGVSVSEYENNQENININNNNSTTSTSTTSNSTTYTFKGFEFNKLSGYSYEEEDDLLRVFNSNYGITINVTNISFDLAKNSYSQLKTNLEKQGIIVKNIKTTTNNNIEYILVEYSMENYNGIYYVTKASDNYVFEGIIMNSNNSIDYSNLNILEQILKNAKYVGNYSNYSKSFEKNVSIEKYSTFKNN